MTTPPHWDELDEELKAWFQALADETPPLSSDRIVRVRSDFAALVRALGHGFAKPKRRWLLRPAWRWAWMGIAFVCLVAFTGVVVVRAAESAWPGSPLYRVKQWHETLRLTWARDPYTKAQLHRQFAYRHIYELRNALAQGRPVNLDPLLQEMFQHIDALSALAAQQGTDPQLLSEVQTLLPLAHPDDQQRLLQLLNALQRGNRRIGVLQKRRGNLWTIDGLQVRLDAETLVQGLPREGDVVEVIGTPEGPNQWRARWIRPVVGAAQRSPLEIEVVAELHREQGQWRLGAYTVHWAQEPPPSIPDNAPVRARLRWDPTQQRWIVTHIQPIVVYQGEMREIEGRLQALDQNRLLVQDRWWTLSPSTEVEGVLRPGVWVELEVWRDVHGRWHVLEVEVEEPEEHDLHPYTPHEDPLEEEREHHHNKNDMHVHLSHGTQRVHDDAEVHDEDHGWDDHEHADHQEGSYGDAEKATDEATEDED